MKATVFSTSSSVDSRASEFFRSLEDAGVQNTDFGGCMQTITAEQDRLNNPDAPCDDGRAGFAA